MKSQKTKRTCKFGHVFYKSSECPTCPTCEKLKESATGFLGLLSNPARNTLLNHGIDTIQKLANHTEKEILALHGMGKASLPTLHKALADEQLNFKNSNNGKNND
ncbi:RNA polymerase alpha subunit C-terminal domain-containing protein [Lunatibacter salilacus]|uniref:RNA polymerase alpha subunit C-terminal domain-containing protein n=1 Tax=Lunatibacter salilacus TaxID=2483804 RepID=UPI00131C91C2|nr:RNA polymerase alpha subunit C-terminal domain-containing protein [Lunatibacter salilacus]